MVKNYLTVFILGDVEVSSSEWQRRKFHIPRGDVRAPRGDTRAPRGDVTAPRGDAIVPRGDVAAPRDDTRAPRGDTRAPRGDVRFPWGDISTPKGYLIALRGDTRALMGRVSAPRGDNGQRLRKKEKEERRNSVQRKFLLRGDISHTRSSLFNDEVALKKKIEDGEEDGIPMGQVKRNNLPMSYFYNDARLPISHMSKDADLPLSHLAQGDTVRNSLHWGDSENAELYRSVLDGVDI